MRRNYSQVGRVRCSIQSWKWRPFRVEFFDGASTLYWLCFAVTIVPSSGGR